MKRSEPVGALAKGTPRKRKALLDRVPVTDRRPELTVTDDDAAVFVQSVERYDEQFAATIDRDASEYARQLPATCRPLIVAPDPADDATQACAFDATVPAKPA